jgi:hypothetical protein
MFLLFDLSSFSSLVSTCLIVGLPSPFKLKHVDASYANSFASRAILSLSTHGKDLGPRAWR